MANDIPQWAHDRVQAFYVEQCHWEAPHSITIPPEDSLRDAFARYIAEHEEPPVDPLLIEAREITAVFLSEAEAECPLFYVSPTLNCVSPEKGAAEIRAGNADDAGAVQRTLTALRRGIELGKAGSQ